MRGRRPLFNPAQDAEIASLYAGGKTIFQLAELKGVSRRAITNSLNRTRTPIRPRNSPRPEADWTICECGNRATYKRGVCRACYDQDRNRDPEAQDRKLTWKLRKYFNLSREDYDRLLLNQRGTCAICRSTNPHGNRLAIDHDHTCCPGEYSCGRCIRGLLCNNCNRALGYLHDNTEVAANLVAYLDSHRENTFRKMS